MKVSLINSRFFIACFLSAVIIIFFIAANMTAQSKKQSIAGTWKLIAYEDHLPEGQIEYPFGKHPVGLLIYDTNGYMAIQIMKTPHPKVASGDDEKITTEEKMSLFDSYVAYFGRYTVDWKKQIVTHNVEGDLADVYIGTAQERPFELKGDRLSLLPQWTEASGVKVKGVRIFERVKK